jgi:hypothetical protein
VKLIWESICWAIAEFSKDACRMDIAVAPIITATMNTRKRGFRNPKVSTTSAPRQIRQGETAL